jgi:hypothetical protein
MASHPDPHADAGVHGSEPAGQLHDLKTLQEMARLPEVEKWRATLSPFYQLRWSSFQSAENRCPAFRNGRPPKGPVVKARPLSVSELLKMPSERAAQLLYDRCPSKAWAIRRALDTLLDAGKAPRVVSGWEAGRARAAAAPPS